MELNSLLAAQSPAKPPQQIKPSAEILKTAKQFEAMVVAEMLKPMFSGLKTDGAFGGGQGEEMFRPMLVDEYAKAIAGSGGIGLADSVAREMMKLQMGAP